jgi:hypothetical protein
MPAPQAGAPVKYKGIWESVSYPDDIHFFDTFFVTADEGWVAGQTFKGSREWILQRNGGHSDGETVESN